MPWIWCFCERRSWNLQLLVHPGCFRYKWTSCFCTYVVLFCSYQCKFWRGKSINFLHSSVAGKFGFRRYRKKTTQSFAKKYWTKSETFFRLKIMKNRLCNQWKKKMEGPSYICPERTLLKRETVKNPFHYKNHHKLWNASIFSTNWEKIYPSNLFFT